MSKNEQLKKVSAFHKELGAFIDRYIKENNASIEVSIDVVASALFNHLLHILLLPDSRDDSVYNIERIIDIFEGVLENLHSSPGTDFYEEVYKKTVGILG